MISTVLVQKLRNGLHAFRTAERGHVVITFALVTIPIMGFIGSASTTARQLRQIRDAVRGRRDRAHAVKGRYDAHVAQISQKATAYFNALYNRAEVAGITITPTYTSGSGAQLVVTGSGSLNTTFMKAMGLQTLGVNVSSTVKWGNTDCASRLRSTIPARWQTPARSLRSRRVQELAVPDANGRGQ